MICATAASANEAGVTKVLDYLPAPGQFVNALPMYEDGNTKQDMLDKCLTRLQANQYITLGSFGGYVVVGFDHSILNTEGNDFEVVGNAMPTSKEPAIVMVSKDENGNGLADDTWYELAGSNYNGEKNKKNFSITYQKPTAVKSPISWTNSDGESGEFSYLPCNSFIDPNGNADNNYPKWISDESITYTGTLIDYADVAGMTFGYADLLPENKGGNPFDLDWAVDADGNAVELSSIDFVKVYNCINKITPPFGEVSTEVVNVKDLHPDAVLPIEVATLEELVLDPESHVPGNWTAEEDEMTSFINGSFEFKTFAMADYGTWSFFGYSNETATTYAGLDDQFRNVIGSGVDGSENYGIAYAATMMGYTDVTLPNHAAGAVVPGFYITNTAYVKNSLENGDSFSKKFEKGDWFKLTVTGYNGETETGTVDYYLADFRSDNEAEHYIVSEWEWMDLSSLGAVTKMRFSMNSTDVGDWGMNTPAYFAFDNFGAEAPEVDDVPTNIVNANSATLTVYSHNQNIFVNDAEIGEQISVYSISGKMIYNGTISSTTEVITLPYNGVAIVKLANQAAKVILK